MAIDYTPRENSFLWVTEHAHPNAQVKCGNYGGSAGSVAKDVRHMLDEIERLRVENHRLSELANRLSDRLVGPSF